MDKAGKVFHISRIRQPGESVGDEVKDNGTGQRRGKNRFERGPTAYREAQQTDDFVPVQRAYLGCATDDDCPAAIAASPFYTIDPSDPPFFVAHSTVEKIPIGQAEIFVAGLRAAGVPTEYVTVEGALHSIAMLDADLKARIIEFFDGTIGTPADPLVQPGDNVG